MNKIIYRYIPLNVNWDLDVTSDIVQIRIIKDNEDIQYTLDVDRLGETEMSKSINSKTKGKVGELELVHYLKEKGYDVRRTSQYCGQTGDASDVTGLEWVHPEVKRVERLNIDTAMEQAVRDSAETSKFPVVFHRKNRKPWLVTMRIDDWLELYEEFLSTHPVYEKESD